MKPKLLHIGDDLIAVQDISRVSRSSRPLESIDCKTAWMDGVRFHLKDGTDFAYYGHGLWEAVEAWLAREAVVIPFAIKTSEG